VFLISVSQVRQQQRNAEVQSIQEQFFGNVNLVSAGRYLVKQVTFTLASDSTQYHHEQIASSSLDCSHV